MGGGHPLDPLTPAEITAAAHACSSYAVSQDIRVLRFNTLTLKEPLKADLLAYSNQPETATIPLRQAFCTLQIPGECGKVIEAVVGFLDAAADAKVESWTVREGVQPLFTPDDCFEAEAIVKADLEVRKMLKETYSIEDLDMVACDPWSVHLPPCPGRLIQTFMYQRVGHVDDNAYAHPIDFVPIVDLDARKVIRIDRPYGNTPPPVPSETFNYHRDLCELPIRTGLKPLDIVQPEGGSWTVKGNLVEWQNWSIRVGFNAREGLVLHQVTYKDGDRVRPILHRASMVEMAVPYAAPQEPFTRKCAFDVGDYGLGNCAVSLALGCDCLGNIHYFDGVLNNSKGEPVTLTKAICMHEEDAGLLFKHVEYRTGHNESRRSRRLVLSFIATVVNYEYAMYWYFGQDGTISYDIKLTGELSTNMVSPEEDACLGSDYGTLVAPGVNAQYHQHMFSVRLDLAVDDALGGRNLKVSEIDVVALPQHPETNPAGNAFIVQETVLQNEAEAQRIADPMKARYWKVSNPNSIHPTTKKGVGYKIMAPGAPLLLAAPGSSLTKRGAFATRTLWVTPHKDEEKYPAGDYPTQAEGGEGLPTWTAVNRSLEDPVVWLTLGATHIPRVEDFPIMPCEVVGFMLKPFCFFNGNPGVDLPADANAASTLAGNSACCAANGTA